MNASLVDQDPPTFGHLKIFYFSVFLFFSFWVRCDAGDIKSGFVRANLFYERGHYDEAIKEYNGILEGGLESGNLYYNLGNCYFKKGELGRAILNYEKARRHMPLDKDLESNYEYAGSLIKGRVVAAKKNPLLWALNNFFEKFTVDGLTMLLYVCYVLILVSILTCLFFGAFQKHALISAVFLALFFTAGFTALRGKVALVNKEAIVVAKTADAKFEPMAKATTYFTLYEGMKAEVVASQDPWHKVRRQDNKSGWIENSAVAIF